VITTGADPAAGFFVLILAPDDRQVINLEGSLPRIGEGF